MGTTWYYSSMACALISMILYKWLRAFAYSPQWLTNSEASDIVFCCKGLASYITACTILSYIIVVANLSPHSHQNNKQTVNQKVMTSVYMLTKPTITTLSRYVDSLLSYTAQYLYSKPQFMHTHTHAHKHTHKHTHTM